MEKLSDHLLFCLELMHWLGGENKINMGDDDDDDDNDDDDDD